MTSKRAPSRRALVQTLEDLKRAGVKHLPRRRGDAGSKTAVASETASAVPEPPARSTARAARPDNLFAGAEPRPPAMSRDEVVAALEVIQAEVSGCTRCRELAETRTQTVFGVGNPQARLVFCGEAPGADEDRLGEPFVGRAGQLLTKIIEACTLTRDDVYILNVLKCRPPDNRNPLPDEVANCRGYLDRQLAAIRPEYICCLGSIAAQTLLETNVTIGRLRKKFHNYQGIPVLVTYHPAYLLRNPAAKRDVWEDMQLLMREMGIELPQAGRG